MIGWKLTRRAALAGGVAAAAAGFAGPARAAGPAKTFVLVHGRPTAAGYGAASPTGWNGRVARSSRRL